MQQLPSEHTSKKGSCLCFKHCLGLILTEVWWELCLYTGLDGTFMSLVMTRWYEWWCNESWTAEQCMHCKELQQNLWDLVRAVRNDGMGLGPWLLDQKVNEMSSIASLISSWPLPITFPFFKTISAVWLFALPTCSYVLLNGRKEIKSFPPRNSDAQFCCISFVIS